MMARLASLLIVLVVTSIPPTIYSLPIAAVPKDIFAENEGLPVNERYERKISSGMFFMVVHSYSFCYSIRTKTIIALGREI